MISGIYIRRDIDKKEKKEGTKEVEGERGKRMISENLSNRITLISDYRINIPSANMS